MSINDLKTRAVDLLNRIDQGYDPKTIQPTAIVLQAIALIEIASILKKIEDGGMKVKTEEVEL